MGLEEILIAQRPASSNSAIFRTRTSSSIYKYYMKMREGWDFYSHWKSIESWLGPQI
jgi:hypothetical protein